MIKILKDILKNKLRNFIVITFPEISEFKNYSPDFSKFKNVLQESIVDEKAKLYSLYKVYNTTIDSYTYIANNSIISMTTIGKFCSIGPNFLCGWGIHPINGISTAPMFYSISKQNGITLSQTNKVVERKKIIIGNDVFIGANVTVLDGVTIGDGAVIGAGSVVSKNIPPYAVAVGSPIQIIKYRFDDSQIEALLKIKWWDFSEGKLRDVEKMFFDINLFIEKYKND